MTLTAGPASTKPFTVQFESHASFPDNADVAHKLIAMFRPHNSGETDLGRCRPRALAGQCDAALNEIGLKQAQLTGWRLRNQRFTDVICSDQRAARQTVEELLRWMPLSKGAEVIYDSRLREKDCADLAGMPWPRVKEKLKVTGQTLEQYLKDNGGETAQAFEDRVLDCYAERIVTNGLLEPSGMQASDADTLDDASKTSASDPLDELSAVAPTPSNPARDAGSSAPDLHVNVLPSAGQTDSVASMPPWKQLTSPQSFASLSPDERRALALLPSPSRGSASVPSSPCPRSSSSSSLFGQRGHGKSVKFGSTGSIGSRGGSKKASIRSLIDEFEKIISLPTKRSLNKKKDGLSNSVVTIDLPLPNGFRSDQQGKSLDGQSSRAVKQKEDDSSAETAGERTPTDGAHRNILIVTHGGVLQALFTHLINELEFELCGEIQAGFPKHCGLYELQFHKVVYGNQSDDEWEWRGIISQMNSVSHNALLGRKDWHQWSTNAAKPRQQHSERKAKKVEQSASQNGNGVGQRSPKLARVLRFKVDMFDTSTSETPTAPIISEPTPIPPQKAISTESNIVPSSASPPPTITVTAVPAPTTADIPSTTVSSQPPKANPERFAEALQKFGGTVASRRPSQDVQATVPVAPAPRQTEKRDSFRAAMEMFGGKIKSKKDIEHDLPPLRKAADTITTTQM